MKIHNPDILNYTGWELIQKETANNTSSIDFILPSRYNHYMLQVRSVVPEMDNDELWMRFSTDGGSTFLEGASDYAWIVNGSSSTGLFAGTGSTGDTKIKCSRGSGAGDLGNGANENYNATFFLSNMHQATVYPTVGGKIHYWRSDGARFVLSLTGSLIANIAAVDAVRILAENLSITSGEFELYGLGEAL